jgi:hypothetical protein
MSDPAAAARLSDEEIVALRFAAHRQLARWSNKPQLSPDQYARRDALKRVVGVLHDPAFAHGCELHSPSSGEPR